MAKVVSFGELLVDMVSDADVGLAAALRFLKAPGGAPANVAVGLQRLGIEARFVGQVGADPFGDWLKEIIARENVDTQFLLQTDLARTTMAFVATRADGKKDICFYRNPGADALLSPELIDEKLFEDARIFHCGSISLSENPARAAQFKAAQLARELGVLVSFDPNWRPSIWRDHSAARDLIWEMMRLSDIVKVADEEWEFVTGETDLEKGAQKILEAGPQLIVVTRGAAGAYFSCKNCDGEIVSGEAAGFPVDAIDTLGAGDAFVAGLLFRLLEYSRLEDALTLSGLQNALRFANACGALATMECGAIPAMPTKMQAETFYGRRTMNEKFRKFSHGVSELAGTSWAFLAAVAIVVIWIFSGPVFHYSDTWQLVINTGTTIITFLMVFLIQNTQNRDSKAMQLKLDELIRAVGDANDNLIDIEELSDEQLKQLQQTFRRLPENGNSDSSISKSINEEIAGREQKDEG